MTAPHEHPLPENPLLVAAKRIMGSPEMRNAVDYKTFLLLSGGLAQSGEHATVTPVEHSGVKALTLIKQAIEQGCKDGVVTDTLWMASPCHETVIDFIDAELAQMKRMG